MTTAIGIVMTDHIVAGRLEDHRIAAKPLRYPTDPAEPDALAALPPTELVHIGQAVMTLGGTVDYFIDTVFNYPTLAECYKVAAFNGLGRLRQYQAD